MILVGAFDLKVKSVYDFTDTIEGDEETRNSVRALYSNGVTTGFSEDATLRPEKSLTRQQFAVFMFRPIHIDPGLEAKPIVIPGQNDDVANAEFLNTEGYDRYAFNFELTPLAEIENFPTNIEALVDLEAIYKPKHTGMSLEL